MKSQQQELSIKTNCKECVFAIYNDKTQVSCEFDRIKKFGTKVVEAYDDDKEFYVIDTLCCYYRDKNKGHTLADKDKVIAESSLSFDLIINCNELSEQSRNDVVDFLRNYNYYANKTKILLVHEYDKKDNVKNHVEYIARRCDSNVNISICADINLFLNEYIMKTRNLCHILVNDASRISPDITLRVNNFVNDSLGRFLVIHNNDHLCISNIAYKMQNMRVEKDNYIDNIKDVIDQAKNHKLYIEI